MIPGLIYDVGAGKGFDTDYYLYKGYNVVAIEADPQLCTALRVKFEDALYEGKLTLLEVAIAETAGQVTFWRNLQTSNWSSIFEELGTRGEKSGELIVVNSVPFREVLQEHGIPYYLKIDIEGADTYCLRDLERFKDDLPPYISVEATSLEVFCCLSSLGYKKFKFVDQSGHNDVVIDPNWTFPDGSSGPFGEDTPGPWTTLEKVVYEWLHPFAGYPERRKRQKTWNDVHATFWRAL